MRVKIKKLHKDAVVPTYGTSGAACFDLYAVSATKQSITSAYTHHQTMTCNTGLAFEVPEGYVMMVYSRSGHGFKDDTRLANCVGVIDSDYRGEVVVKLTFDGVGSFPNIKEGQRIAQAMIVPVNQVSFDVVEELNETSRGVGGFGSTGTN